MAPVAKATSYQVISRHGFAEVRFHATSGHHALHALCSFKKEEVITGFQAGTIHAVPNYLTLQVGEGQHISLAPDCLQYTNHSCAPNVFFDTSAMQLVALTDIEPGDELHFFYPSTEWEMAQPFVCHCGQPGCLQTISGASGLQEEQWKEYRLTEFIHARLREKHTGE